MRSCGISISCAAVGLIFALEPHAASANDGVDRYRGPTPAELRLFDAPGSDDAGYRFLPEDSVGGADGDAAYRWASPLGVALVRLTAHRVASTLGPGAHAMPIFDLSAENGDTPVSFGDDTTPRGRHPGGSHDGGTNLDLGYYLTSLDGQVFSPDYAACSDHFSDDGEQTDLWQCDGPPDRLDVDRQSLLLLELAKIHHRDFGDGLIEEIGIDDRIRTTVLERLAAWARAGRHGARRELVAELDRRMTSDRFEGWARSHHHHIHLRLQRIAALGPPRPAVERLLERERELDERLPRGNGPALLTRVGSYGLSRTLALDVLRARDVQGCEYRIDGGEWIEASSEDGRWRHVEDLPTPVGREGRSARVEARLSLRNGETLMLARAIDLPRQDPEIWVSVDPAQIRVRRLRRGRSLVLWLTMPRAYRLYVTDVRYEIVFRDGETTTVEGRAEVPTPLFRAEVQLPVDASQARLGRARLVLSGRLSRTIPFVLP